MSNQQVTIERIPAEWETLLPSYPFLCPACRSELSATPSWLMQTGVNSGHITCPECLSFLHLQINASNTGMDVELWDGWFTKQLPRPIEESFPLSQLFPVESVWFHNGRMLTVEIVDDAGDFVILDGERFTGREARDQLEAMPF